MSNDLVNKSPDGMILFISNASTELLALRMAVEMLPSDMPAVRGTIPEGVNNVISSLSDISFIVLRLLGGVKSWTGELATFHEYCIGHGIPLLVFGGEATYDNSLEAFCSIDPLVCRDYFNYLSYGGGSNMANLLIAIWQRLEGRVVTAQPPVPVPMVGYMDLAHSSQDHPTGTLDDSLAVDGKESPRASTDIGDRIGTGIAGKEDAIEDAAADADSPRIGIVAYRAQNIAGNTAYIQELAKALEECGSQPVGVYTYSLRSMKHPEDNSMDHAGNYGLEAVSLLAAEDVDAVIVTTMSAGQYDPETESYDAYPLCRLNVPILQGICSMSTREEFENSALGLQPLDAAVSVAMPEVDGRITTVPFSFKEVVDEDEIIGAPLAAYRCIPDRVERVASIAHKMARLGKLHPSQRRIAVVLSAYPTRLSRLGNAVGLDTPRSVLKLMRTMITDGYYLTGIPESGDDLMHQLAASLSPEEYREYTTGMELSGSYAGNSYEHTGSSGDAADDASDASREKYPDNNGTEPSAQAGRYISKWTMDVQNYKSIFSSLDPVLQQQMLEQWGEPLPPSGSFEFSGLDFGNVIVTIQPPRGFGDDPVSIYHSPDLPPTHHYLAFYRWLEEVWGADAIIHMGKHGTLEWLPGKGTGLSARCCPDAVLGSVPLIYPFIVNDPGEGIQAKRRSHAIIIDHMVPPLTNADIYGGMARLESLLDEYAKNQLLDPAKLPQIREEITELMISEQIHRDMELNESDIVDKDSEDFNDIIPAIDGYLCEIKDAQIRGGLHILGEAPTGDSEIDMIMAITRLPQGNMPSLYDAIERASIEEGMDGDSENGLDGDVKKIARRLLVVMQSNNWNVDASLATGRPVDASNEHTYLEKLISNRTLRPVLDWIATKLIPNLRATKGEIDAVLKALNGEFIMPGPSGAPSRGMANVLPTGRNFYSCDPRAIPSKYSYQTGSMLAESLIERYMAEEGKYPTRVAIVVWGTAVMRTSGDDIAQALSLIGVRPQWDAESGRIIDLDVIALEELGRPRVDVVLRVSGFFRDAFSNLIAMFNDAVAMVSALDEPTELNPLKSPDAHLARVFGPKPGAYGSGVLDYIESGKWVSPDDLAVLYLERSSYAYASRRGSKSWMDSDVNASYAIEELEHRLSSIDIAAKNQDNREHDIFDSDDYFQEHGGLIAAIRMLRGSAPKSYFGDSSVPDHPKVRDLAQEVARVVRTRVVNPKWINAMMAHGYKGAFEMAATVDYMFGYDATAGVIDDWMYNKLTEAYVADKEVRDFFKRSNPWALASIVNRLLEAARREMWNPSDKALEALRMGLLETEGWAEEAQ